MGKQWLQAILKEVSNPKRWSLINLKTITSKSRLRKQLNHQYCVWDHKLHKATPSNTWKEHNISRIEINKFDRKIRKIAPIWIPFYKNLAFRMAFLKPISLQNCPTCNMKNYHIRMIEKLRAELSRSNPPTSKLDMKTMIIKSNRWNRKLTL